MENVTTRFAGPKLTWQTCGWNYDLTMLQPNLIGPELTRQLVGHYKLATTACDMDIIHYDNSANMC